MEFEGCCRVNVDGLHWQLPQMKDDNPIVRLNISNVHFSSVSFLFYVGDNALLMFWWGVGTETSWLGLGKDHVLSTQSRLETVTLRDVETQSLLQPLVCTWYNTYSRISLGYMWNLQILCILMIFGTKNKSFYTLHHVWCGLVGSSSPFLVHLLQTLCFTWAFPTWYTDWHLPSFVFGSGKTYGFCLFVCTYCKYSLTLVYRPLIHCSITHYY